MTVQLRGDAVSWTPTETGAIVILDLRTSKYLTLNNSAAVLWQRLADGDTEEQLAATLSAEYSLAPDAAAHDVASFLADLRRRDMLDE